jgi:hypothetical protein
MARKRTRFTWTHYLIRLGAALVLVFATYNPEGWSYFHWIKDMLRGEWGEAGPLMAFGGILLIIGWAVFLRATSRSLGIFGTILAIAFFGIMIWLLITLFPALMGNTALVYLFLIGLAGVLSMGISWSHVRRRMTGQFDVDEADI